MRELSVKNILYYKFEWQTENFISFLVIFIIRNFYLPKNESQIIFSRAYDSKTVRSVAKNILMLVMLTVYTPLAPYSTP